MIHALRTLVIPVLAYASIQAMDPVVMVADLAGRVLRGGGQPLTLAEGIPAHRGLILEGGARLVVIHLKTGEELVFTGPGSVRFDREGQPLGARPTSRRQVAALGAGLRLEPGAWAQASVVMRKEVSPGEPFLLEIEEPMPFQPGTAEEGQGVWLKPRGTAVLEGQPGFRWHLPLPGLVAKLQLSDATGKQLFEENVQGDGLDLPTGRILPAGGAYRWRLSWRLPDGQEPHVEGGFTVLSTAEARLVRSLRPPEDAPFPERLAFAVALESRGLRDEARHYWIRLAAERPEDATLQRFATP